MRSTVRVPTVLLTVLLVLSAVSGALGAYYSWVNPPELTTAIPAGVGYIRTSDGTEVKLGGFVDKPNHNKQMQEGKLTRETSRLFVENLCQNQASVIEILDDNGFARDSYTRVEVNGKIGCLREGSRREVGGVDVLVYRVPVNVGQLTVNEIRTPDIYTSEIRFVPNVSTFQRLLPAYTGAALAVAGAALSTLFGLWAASQPAPSSVDK